MKTRKAVVDYVEDKRIPTRVNNEIDKFTKLYQEAAKRKLASKGKK